MKRKWLVLTIVAAILTFTLLPLNFLSAAPGNRIKNGDFEGNSLDYWSSWGTVNVAAEAVTITSTPVIDGNSGISQTVDTTEKNLIFSFDVNPVYTTDSGIQIAFSLYKNGAFQGQAFGYFNELTESEWTTVSFNVEDFWHAHTGALYADFDQIKITAETYFGCVAQFDNFTLENIPSTSLTVTKGADGSSQGYLTWTIDKSVDQSSFDLATGQTATANYTVTVTPAYHETGRSVSGSIHIQNDTGAPDIDKTASITYVKDMVEYEMGGTWYVLKTNDIGGPFTIPTGDFADVPYSVSFTPVEGATAYRNTALVGLENYAIPGGGIGFQEFTYTTDFSISGGTVISDAFVVVSDSLKGYLGTTWVGDPSKTYTYSLSVGPYSAPGDYTKDNTATVEGLDSHIKSTDSVSIAVHVVYSKGDALINSGVPGKGLDTAPGQQKPFNPKSQASENAGKKK